MKADDVKIGKFFVCERLGLIREIVVDVDGDVNWQAYDIKSGQATMDHGQCSKYQITQWADREASPEEIASIQYKDRLTEKESDFVRELITRALPVASDEELLNEISRRGYKVVKKR
jgi:hypothetical protein